MLTADQVMPKERIQQEHSSLRSWIVCISAALFFFYEFIQMNMFNALGPQLMQAFSLNADQLAKLSSYYFYANLFFLFPAGLILDRFSTRKIILTAMVICVGGTFLFAISKDIHLAELFRFLTGIGSAFCFLSCIRLASRWFPAKKMALISGLIVTMAMLGGSVAQTMTKLAELVGWRHALIFDAALGAVIIMIIFMLVRDYPENKEHMHQSNREQMQAIGFFTNIRQSYFRLQNWLCGIYTSLMDMPICVLGAFMGQVYLEQVHHLTPTDASLVTSMIFIGTVIGSPLAGLISDRMGYRKLPMILGACITLVIVSLIIYLPLQNLFSLLVLFFALGFFTSTQIISYPLVTESNNRLFTASAVSVVSFSAISGFPITQQLFGYLLDKHWNKLIVNNEAVYSAANFHSALIILPIGFAIALIAALLMKETYCKPLDEAK